MNCTACGEPADPTFQFCRRCGASLEAQRPRGAQGLLVAVMALVLALAGAGAFFALRTAGIAPKAPVESPEVRPAEPRAPPPAPPPPPAPRPRALSKIGPAAYRFAAPGDPERGGEDARLLFDNGLAVAMEVRLEDGAARFEVPTRTAATLVTRPGRLRFATSLPNAAADEQTVALEPHHTYVYNPGAAWDYTLETHYYSDIPTLGLGPRSHEVRGAVFFDAGPVDHLFEAAPDSIQVTTFAGAPAQGSRERLARLGEAPAEGREVRRVAGRDGTSWRVVALGQGDIAVTALGALEPPTATLFLDGDQESGSLALRIDGAHVADVAAGDILRVRLAPGEHALEAGAAGRRETFPAGGRFLFSPAGRRALAIDYRVYGDFAPPEAKREPDLARGIRFLEIRTTVAFDEFPETIRTSGFQLWSRVSRLQLDAAGPVAEDLRKEIDAVAAAADAELPAAQRDALRARIPPAGAPVSDLDLWIAQATLALARSDFDAAIAACDAYLAFVPEEAIALKLRGLARAGAKHWADAADDLAAALQREPAWETELSPRLAACRKAAAEQEERARAEEERREKEERGGEMPEGGDDR